MLAGTEISQIQYFFILSDAMPKVDTRYRNGLMHSELRSVLVFLSRLTIGNLAQVNCAKPLLKPLLGLAFCIWYFC